MMSHVLGIDASTTAAKAILVDGSGAVRGVGTAAYELSVPHPLWSEQEPRLWWDGTLAAIRAVLAETGIPGDHIAAVGLTGQMHGAVLLDAADEVLRPAILWNDQRTGARPDPGGRRARAPRLDHRQRRPHRLHGAEARLGP